MVLQNLKSLLKTLMAPLIYHNKNKKTLNKILNQIQENLVVLEKEK